MDLKTKYANFLAMCQELLDLGPVDRELGICNSLAVRSNGEFYNCVCLFERIVEQWPHFSGSLTYPVPGDGTDYTNPGDCFNRVENLWEGTQGELRRELLHFIIQQCKREILNLSFPERDIGPFRALLVE